MLRPLASYPLRRTLLSFTCLVLATAAAAGAQPTFTKTFLPDTIGPGSTSMLRFDINNTNGAVVANDLAFSDTLPAGVVIAAAPGAFSTCGGGGILSAPAGGGTITFSNGQVGAGASCFVRVNVTSSSVGTHMNVSGALNSSAGSSGTASDDLMVVTSRPSFTKSFSPSTVSLGGRSTLTFVIDNSANGSAVLNLDFTDNLPTGMVIASPSNAATTCVAPIPSTTLTATPGTNVITLNADGSSGNPVLTTDASCTVIVDVIGGAQGALGNVSGELTSTIGSTSGISSGKAAATLTVTAAALTIEKTFTNDPVPPGGTVTLQFKILNLSRTEAASMISFTDNLGGAGGTLTGLAAVAPLPANPCGAGSTLSGTTTLTLSGGSLPAEGMCTFSVTLQVPAGASPGSYTNTTSAVMGEIGGDGTTGNQAIDPLFVEPIPRLTKQFTDDPVAAGNDVTLRFTVTNTSTTSMATNVAFTDELTTFLGFPVTVASPTLPAAACGGTLSLVSCGTDCQALSLTGGSLAASGMCTFDVVITIPADQPAGTFLNTTGAPTATVDGATRTGKAASDNLVVVTAPRLTKAFPPDPVLPGSTVVLEFTLTHALGAPTDATNIAFTDDLNAALAGLASTSGTQTNICGSGSQITGTTLLSFSGGTLSPGGSCTFSVTVQVPANAPPGNHNNVTSNVTATVAGLAVSKSPATAILQVAALKASKSFTNDPTVPGGTVTLEFTLENQSPDTTANSISFTDNLTAALTGLVSTSGTVMNVCGSGSQITGTSTLSFTGGTLAPLASCTFSVTLSVPASVPPPEVLLGDHLNRTSAVSATYGANTVLAPRATDTLTVSEPLSISKQFTNDPVAPGGMVNLRFRITNADAANAATGISFSDNLGDAGGTLLGLAATGLPAPACGGTLSGTTTISLAGGSVAAGSFCEINVTLNVPPGAAAGTYPNTTSQVSGTINMAAVTGDPATDNLRVQAVTFTKAFSGPTTATGTVQLSFTITNLDASSGISSLDFSDNLGGLGGTLSGLAASPPLPAIPCGAGSALSGTTTLLFSGGNLTAAGTPGDSCTFVVDLQVPAGAAPGSYPNTTSSLTSSGLAVADPATDTLVVEPPPTFAKSFNPASIASGQVSTLSFVIDNTASAVAATSLAFTDNLPAGIVVAAMPNVSPGCGGTATASPGTGTISLSGGTVGAGLSCTIQVDVTSVTPGSHLNTTGDLTSSSGNSGTASDTLVVDPPPTFAKSFSPDPIAQGGVSTLTFTIDNTAGTVPATALAFTDNLPLEIVVASTPNESTTCLGGTLAAVAGSGTISYTGGTVSGGTSCTVQVDVTSITSGTHSNTSGDLTSSLGNSGTASDTLTVAPPPGFSKEFMPDAIAPGGVSTLTFTIDNTSSALDATGLAFTDNLPAGVVVASPNNAADGCGGTLTATPGSGTITYSGGTATAGTPCSVSVDVTSSSVGTHTNTSGNLTSSLGDSGTASDDLSVVAGVLGFSKSVTPDPVLRGGLMILEFTITNTSPSFALTDIAFTDDLEAVLTGLAAIDTPKIGVCGPMSQLTGTSVLTFTGGFLAPNSSCTFTATLQVPADAALGTYTNVTGPITSEAVGAVPDKAPVSAPPAMASFQVAFLDFAKAFSPASVTGSSTTSLTFTITNPDAVNAASAITFTDDLDAALPGLVATNTPLSDVCGAGSQLTGSSVLTLTGGSLAAGGSCSFAVMLQVPVGAAGSFTNLTSVVSAIVAANAVVGDPAGAASAVLTVGFNPVEIPTLSGWALILLAGVLVLVAVRRLRMG